MHDHIKEGASMKQDTVTAMEYSFRKKKATREEWAGVIEPHYPRGKRGQKFPEDFLFSSKNP